MCNGPLWGGFSWVCVPSLVQSLAGAGVCMRVTSAPWHPPLHRPISRLRSAERGDGTACLVRPCSDQQARPLCHRAPSHLLHALLLPPATPPCSPTNAMNANADEAPAVRASKRNANNAAADNGPRPRLSGASLEPSFEVAVNTPRATRPTRTRSRTTSTPPPPPPPTTRPPPKPPPPRAPPRTLRSPPPRSWNPPCLQPPDPQPPPPPPQLHPTPPLPLLQSRLPLTPPPLQHRQPHRVLLTPCQLRITGSTPALSISGTPPAPVPSSSSTARCAFLHSSAGAASSSN